MPDILMWLLKKPLEMMKTFECFIKIFSSTSQDVVESKYDTWSRRHDNNKC